MAPLRVVFVEVVDIPGMWQLAARVNALGLVDWVARYGRSHFGWSLPVILAFCFLMRTMSPELI
jgi:hypothetical protein